MENKWFDIEDYKMENARKVVDESNVVFALRKSIQEFICNYNRTPTVCYIKKELKPIVIVGFRNSMGYKGFQLEDVESFLGVKFEYNDRMLEDFILA